LIAVKFHTGKAINLLNPLAIASDFATDNGIPD